MEASGPSGHAHAVMFLLKEIGLATVRRHHRAYMIVAVLMAHITRKGSGILQFLRVYRTHRPACCRAASGNLPNEYDTSTSSVIVEI